MASRTKVRDTSDTVAFRRELGAWLRARREELKLSQTDLARQVGVTPEYYSFISQIENGRGKIPSERYLSWATALQIEPKGFVEKALKYYDPPVHRILFGGD